MSITKGEGTLVLLSSEDSRSVVWPGGFDLYKVSVVNSVLEDSSHFHVRLNMTKVCS